MDWLASRLVGGGLVGGGLVGYLLACLVSWLVLGVVVVGGWSSPAPVTLAIPEEPFRLISIISYARRASDSAS